MKNRILPLSLLIGTVLTIPSVAMAAPTESKPVTAKTVVADNVVADNKLQTITDETLQTDAENADSKLALNQTNAVKISETKTFTRSRATASNQNPTPPVATSDVEADIETIQNPQEALQEEIAYPQEDMVDSQEVM